MELLKQEKVTFTPRNIIHLFIFYELGYMVKIIKHWFYSKRLFRAIKLTKNADPD